MSRWTVYTSAATYRGVWATSAACAKLVVFRRTLGRVAMSDMTAKREGA